MAVVRNVVLVILRGLFRLQQKVKTPTRNKKNMSIRRSNVATRRPSSLPGAGRWRPPDRPARLAEFQLGRPSDVGPITKRFRRDDRRKDTEGAQEPKREGLRKYRKGGPPADIF